MGQGFFPSNAEINILTTLINLAYKKFPALLTLLEKKKLRLSSLVVLEIAR